MIIRKIKHSDAEKLSNLIQEVEGSSEYMLWEAGERKIQPEKLEKVIESMKGSKNSTIFVAEKNSKLVGYLMAIGENARRKKHAVYLVIGLLKEYRGQGVGTMLFERLDQWAVNHHIHRLELTVVTRNEAGVSLYKKMGFEIEGTKRQSLIIDGEFVDEYYMSKFI